MPGVVRDTGSNDSDGAVATNEDVRQGARQVGGTVGNRVSSDGVATGVVTHNAPRVADTTVATLAPAVHLAHGQPVGPQDIREPAQIIDGHRPSLENCPAVRSRRGWRDVFM